MRHAQTTRSGRISASSLTRAAGSGFTLMEMLVAVAAVAVVSVGLAAIFDSVGKTVSGGKRVSLLNTYAGLMESRLRRDFDHMTREGFLTIRQQWVQGPGTTTDAQGRLLVGTSEADRRPRIRRIDELMFFTRGPAESARVPIANDASGNPLVVKSDEARVYYGHGQRTFANDTAGNRRPEFDAATVGSLNDPDAASQNARLGSDVDPDNPNRYAGDWTLLRLQTLLVRPASTTTPPPGLTGVGIPPTDPRAQDNDLQVGGQPAAASVFRSHTRWFPDPSAGPAPVVYPFTPLGGEADTPRFASGLVDIATTDLEEIRAWVTSGQIAPSVVLGHGTPPRPTGFRFPSRSLAYLDPTASTERETTPNALDLAHQWMDDAWPTQSGVLPSGQAWVNNPAPSALPGGSNALDPTGARVRYEPQPPDYFEAMKQTSALRRGAARADQLMLAANNFVPRCSEFIVDWSWGDSDNAGELIWHGLPRTGGSGDTVPYVYDASANPPRHTRIVRLGNANVVAVVPVTARLIYGYTPTNTDNVLTSYFGFTDPTVPAPADGNSDGSVDGASPASPTPWPWPRLIRVTIVLSDPSDPSIESTFQYVFTTPEEPGAQ